MARDCHRERRHGCKLVFTLQNMQPHSWNSHCIQILLALITVFAFLFPSRSKRVSDETRCSDEQPADSPNCGVRDIRALQFELSKGVDRTHLAREPRVCEVSPRAQSSGGQAAWRIVDCCANGSISCTRNCIRPSRPQARNAAIGRRMPSFCL